MSIRAFAFSKLSCTFNVHIYACKQIHTIHMQLQSQVHCLCFLALAIYQLPTGLLVAFCTFKHTHAYAHAHTFMYTHTGVCFNHKHMCICTHKNSFGSHPSYHSHTHTCKFVFQLLSNFPAVMTNEHTY